MEPWAWILAAAALNAALVAYGVSQVVRVDDDELARLARTLGLRQARPGVWEGVVGGAALTLELGADGGPVSARFTVQGSRQAHWSGVRDPALRRPMCFAPELRGGSEIWPQVDVPDLPRWVFGGDEAAVLATLGPGVREGIAGLSSSWRLADGVMQADALRDEELDADALRAIGRLVVCVAAAPDLGEGLIACALRDPSATLAMRAAELALQLAPSAVQPAVHDALRTAPRAEVRALQGVAEGESGWWRLLGDDDQRDEVRVAALERLLAVRWTDERLAGGWAALVAVAAVRERVLRLATMPNAHRLARPLRAWLSRTDVADLPAAEAALALAALRAHAEPDDEPYLVQLVGVPDRLVALDALAALRPVATARAIVPLTQRRLTADRKLAAFLDLIVDELTVRFGAPEPGRLTLAQEGGALVRAQEGGELTVPKRLADR